eukprot:15481833-Alexandrium_andersonii.AAC.1
MEGGASSTGRSGGVDDGLRLPRERVGGRKSQAPSVSSLARKQQKHMQKNSDAGAPQGPVNCSFRCGCSSADADPVNPGILVRWG